MHWGMTGVSMRRRAVTTAAALGFVLAASGVLPATTAAAPVTAGYRDFSYTGASAPTGEKPQSKLWFNDGIWWGNLFNSASKTYHIYRLDWATQTWSDTGTRGRHAAEGMERRQVGRRAPLRGQRRVRDDRRVERQGLALLVQQLDQDLLARLRLPGHRLHRRGGGGRPRDGYDGSRLGHLHAGQQGLGHHSVGCRADDLDRTLRHPLARGRQPDLRRHLLDRRLRRQDRRHVEQPEPDRLGDVLGHPRRWCRRWRFGLGRQHGGPGSPSTPTTISISSSSRQTRPAGSTRSPRPRSTPAAPLSSCCSCSSRTATGNGIPSGRSRTTRRAPSS